MAKSVVDEALASVGPLSQLVLSGNKFTADIVDALTDAQVSRTLDGASVLSLTLEDPRGTLRNSRIFGKKVSLKVDALTYEVVQLSKSGTTLTVTSEDQLVAELRRITKPLAISAGKMTHVQFAEELCKDLRYVKFRTVDDPKKYGVVKSKTPFTRGKPSDGTSSTDEKTDSWATLQDVAAARGWRCFVRSNDEVWYVPDTYLLSRPVAYTLSETSPGVQTIDFDWDAGKEVATCTIICESGRWQVPPGEVVKLKDMGPADGKWLVQDVSKPLFSTSTTITLIHPQPVLPEPKPEPVATAGVDGTGGASGAGGAGSYSTEVSYSINSDNLDPRGKVSTAQYALQAGFRGNALEIALAVSYAGNVLSDAKKDLTIFGTPGYHLRGLWSINSSKYPQYSADDLLDPARNAAAAYEISNGGKSFTPWPEYNSGAYKQWLTVARDAIASAKAVFTKAQQRSDLATSGRTANAFTNLALSQEGKAYVWGSAVQPDNPSPRSFDCSSLVAWAADRIGVNLTGKGIRTAAQEWAYSRDHGGSIGVQQAINTRGALMFQGSPPTHVVISLGNGSTIEAMGDKWGVLVAGTAGRNWTYGAKLPGLLY